LVYKRAAKRTGILMPHYYIDVRSRFGLDEDETGVDLPDADAAVSEDVKVASRLQERWAEIPAEARHYIMIEIIDESLRIVRSIPLAEIEVQPEISDPGL